MRSLPTQYMKVFWKHNLADEPVCLYSELDDDRWETRKVEVFADGTNGYACRDEERTGTKLSIERLPTLEEIAEDPQFVPFVIERGEFERVWQQREQNRRV